MTPDRTPANLADEFFRAPRMPTTTHEEWLLRTCANLMEREASVVSVLEAQARAAPTPPPTPPPLADASVPPKKRRPNRRRSCPTPSSDATAASTAPSTGTDAASWGDS